ncbi:MAG: protein-export chaperone SecB [Lacticaseibacillus paracasei]|uniref:Protein transporter n=2 Tax=root TaxID=1 RepID=A0A2D1GPE1_9CAUD|nr:protein-export chaperone SecB [Lacticaseibacillus paracasei]YP_009835615.1 protein-export chaperone SecB [Lactobacillus phage LJ]ATN93919.1 protein transporter [Lactobacillus phage LJ]MDN6090350.1 protein-export chaperone SecB [Lacticaseibacillus paracasei]MDN6565252.1 protein-export chaperone SecB [Lacticaseibacillus paracasei]RND81812.1 Preprotein translocase subunit SecB [Lacticaseibacillus paracasei]
MNTEDNQSQIEFTDPIVTQSIFLENTEPSKKEKEHGGNIKFQINAGNSDPTEQGQFIASTVMLTVSNMDDEEGNLVNESNNDPFLIRVTVQADFRWPSNTNADRQKAFLHINAPALLLSYARTHIAVVTEPTRFKAQHIPFIDFTEHNE